MQKWLKALFVFIFIAMVAVTTWASMERNVFLGGVGLWPDRWFIATLFDTYFAFITFYLWLAYKETSLVARVIWFILIMALGNMAMATYMLIQLYRLKPGDSWEALLLRAK